MGDFPTNQAKSTPPIPAMLLATESTLTGSFFRGVTIDRVVALNRSQIDAMREIARRSDAETAMEWAEAEPETRSAALIQLLEFADAFSPVAQPERASISRPEKVIGLHRALDQAQVGHAFGGGIAVAFYGIPRVTVDIDINVFVPPNGWPTVSAAALALDPEIEIISPPCPGGRAELNWNGTRIDVFFATEVLHEAMEQRLRRVPFGSARISIPAPEHVVVWKTLSGRPRDRIDIEQIVAVTENLDLAEIERWLALMPNG